MSLKRKCEIIVKNNVTGGNDNEFLAACIKSVTRRKGKSFILFLVIFILGNVIAGAVAVQQSTMNVERETKKKMGNVATVEFDYEQFEKDNSGKSDEEVYSEENSPKTPKRRTMTKWEN